MKVSATQKHARMSPRKLRPYARMIQGMPVIQAQNQLDFAVGKAPVIILDVLKSAVANAKNNLQIQEADLKVASILVNQGLVLKRFMPVAKGMAHSILKRTAHVTVIVEGDKKEEGTKKKAAPKKAEKIKTITADEFAKQEKEEAKEEEHDHDHDHEHGHDHLEKHATEERPLEKIGDKQTGAAYQKIKTLQQGSDAKKTHRRKSIG
jgi:large subunit ribosomal protein L22